MKRLLGFFLVLTLAITLSACDSKPSTGEMRSQIQQSMDTVFGEGAFEIEDVEKVKGRMEGEKYIADLTYNLKFNKSAEQLMQDMDKSGNLMGGMALVGMTMQYGNWEAGHSKPQQNSLTFVKTEKGWRIIE